MDFYAYEDDESSPCEMCKNDCESCHKLCFPLCVKTCPQCELNNNPMNPHMQSSTVQSSHTHHVDTNIEATISPLEIQEMK
jgi:hypothetical protein